MRMPGDDEEWHTSADVRRLTRRAVRGLVGAARADERPTLWRLLATRNAMTRVLLGAGHSPGGDDLP